MRYGMLVGAVLLSTFASSADPLTAKWTNATGNGLWNDARNWVDNSTQAVLTKAPDLDYQCYFVADTADITVDVGSEGARPYKLYLDKKNTHRVILTGTGSYTYASDASGSSMLTNAGKSLVEFRCPVVLEKDPQISYGVVFKGAVTVEGSAFTVNGTSEAYEEESSAAYLRCEILGALSMPGGTLYPASANGNCKVFIGEGADVQVNTVDLGTNGWLQVDGGQLEVENRIQSTNAEAGPFGPRFVQTGGLTKCTYNNKAVSLWCGVFDLQGGVFRTPCDGTSADGVYIRRSGAGNGVSITGGELHTSYVSLTDPESNFFYLAYGGALHLSADPTYAYPYVFTGTAGTSLHATRENAEMRILHHEGDAATLDSACFVTNGVQGTFCVPYGGAVSLSGSGSITMNRFYMRSNGSATTPAHLNAAGLAFNFGPGTNYCHAAGSTLNLSGGASIGAFGADETDWSGEQLMVVVAGAATIRTTDALDGVTPRLVSSFKTELAAAGELTVSGNGTFQPNLSGSSSCRSLALTDTARLVLTPDASLSAESVTLSDGAKIEISVPAGYTQASVAILSSSNLPADLTDHLVISGAGAEGLSVSVRDGAVLLYRASGAVGIEWVGNGEDDKWTTEANWNNGVLPKKDDAVAFGGFKNREVDNDSAVSPSNIWFRSSAGAFTIGGNPITISGRETDYANNIPEEAAVRNQSSFTQTFDTPVTLSGHYASVWCDDIHPVVFNQGLTKSGSVLYLRGTVKVGGTGSVERYIRFSDSGTATPSTLHILPGGSFTINDQEENSLSDYRNPGRIVVDAGGCLTVAAGSATRKVGRVLFVDEQTITVNGELNVNGYFMTDAFDTTFSGTGTVFVAATHSSHLAANGRFHRFVGTDGLTLKLGGDWTTVTDEKASSPSNSVGIALHDGSTLLLAADSVYGPKAGLENLQSTPADRSAIFRDTVTVDTAGHALTFVDPLNAAAATVVKVGAGRLTLSADSTVRDLVVSNGCVRPASWPLEVSEKLTMAPQGTIDAGDATLSAWTDMATAAEIVSPSEKWKVGRVKYRIVSAGARKVLQARVDTGFVISVR